MTTANHENNQAWKLCASRGIDPESPRGKDYLLGYFDAKKDEHQYEATFAQLKEREIAALEATTEGLRRQVEEATTARDYNARQCLQMHDEIIAQGVILRNTVAAVNEQERTIYELRSSTDAKVERAIRLAAPEIRARALENKGIHDNEVVAAVLEQMKGEKE